MSDERPLQSFEVHGYRGIRQLTLPRLGNVNLFVGLNNAGKTSLLQGIQLYLERNSDSLPALVVDLVRTHSDIRLGTDTRSEFDGPNVQAAVESVEALFHGSFAGGAIPSIRFRRDTDSSAKLTLSLPWSVGSAVSHEDGPRRRPVLIDPSELLLEVASEGATTMLPLDWFTQRVSLVGSDAWNDTSFVPAAGFSPTRTRELWDRIVVQGNEALVEEAVRTVVPDLERILVVGELRLRKVLLKLRGVANPVPIKSMGDGTNRVFGLAVALVQARGGAVLIDEVENGLHHSVQSETWHSIFALAELLDVQVFAATHSWDAVVGFQDAANKSALEGVLYRLDRQDDGAIRAVNYTESDVAIAAEQLIEVR